MISRTDSVAIIDVNVIQKQVLARTLPRTRILNLGTIEIYQYFND